MIQVKCPGCGETLKLADHYAGKKGKCPRCKASLTVPSSEKTLEENHIPLATEPASKKLNKALILSITIGCLAIILAVTLTFIFTQGDKEKEEEKISQENPEQPSKVSTDPDDMFYVVRTGDLKMLKSMLEVRPALIDIANDKGDRPLHIAARHGNTHVAEFLIESGAMIEATNKGGFTPLHIAATNGQTETAELLVSRGADVNKKSILGYSPLHCAAHNGHVDLAAFLIAKGANIDAVDKEGWCSLDRAIMQEQKDVASLLRKNGSKVTPKFQSYLTGELFQAVSNGDRKLAENLIHKGADVNTKVYGDTPLHRASKQGHKEIVELLVENGADVNAKDTWDSTVLYRAADKDTAMLLYKHGARLTAKEAELLGKELLDMVGKMPKDMEKIEILVIKGARFIVNGTRVIHEVARDGDIALAKLLVEHGAQIAGVFAHDQKGDTPLHYAVTGGSAKMVEFLISKGADLNAKNTQGQTPLYLAAYWNSPEIAKILIEKGADINAKTNGMEAYIKNVKVVIPGKTPLAIAIEKKSEEVVNLLRQHGAKE